MYRPPSSGYTYHFNDRLKYMNEQELKEKLDQVYNLGVKNGGILMKNKILKSLNRDWKIFSTKQELDIMIKVMKKIDKIK
jgi:hypothetical protein